MALFDDYSQIQNYIDFFQVKSSEINVKYHCNIENCQSSFSDKSCAIRHLRNLHKTIYERISENKKK